MKNYEDFTGLYPLSKTLRFEARPIGKTLEHIIQSNILDQDEKRASDYDKVKKIIDEYHKSFINQTLSGFSLKLSGNSSDSLEEYLAIYNLQVRDDKAKATFKTIQAKLRKQIADCLTKQDAFKTMDKKELIQQDLMAFVKTDEDKVLVEGFRNFTTYFTGFNENRQNMYSAEEKSTSISYRLINDNLPKFIDNINAFRIINENHDLTEQLEQLFNKFADRLSAGSIAEMFEIGYFNRVLTQDGIDLYNAIIGGLNEYINPYNQVHKDNRMPKLKVLFKQILSDRISFSWLPEAFNNDDEVLKAIKKYYDAINDTVLGDKNLKLLLESLTTYSLDGVYINSDALSDISQRMFGSWSFINNAVCGDIKLNNPLKKRESFDAYNDRINKLFKRNDSYSIAYLDQCLHRAGQTKTIEDDYAKLGAFDNESEQRENLLARTSNAYTAVQPLLIQTQLDDTEQESDKKKETNSNRLVQDKQIVSLIKTFLDTFIALKNYIKPLLGKGDESGKDERFYGELTAIYEKLNQITPLYNKVRNYLTKKPYSQDKIKLNFDNPTLLNGWPVNNEISNSCCLLRKNGIYYLCILDKEFKKKFKNIPAPVDKNDVIEKMCYLQAADPSKDVQNLMCVDGVTKKINGRKETEGEFAGQNLRLEKAKNIYLPAEINRIRISKSYSVADKDNFSKDDLITFIDYYKQRTKEYFSSYQFKFKDSSEYRDFSEFTDHINQQAYQIHFINISQCYIDQLIDNGSIYLFQIYNKDFSTYSKGTPNMHTLYWKMLFDEQNLIDTVYKLNGEAEMFYRKKSLNPQKPTHPAHLPIKNKNADNPKAESLFDYDLIKDRRYTVDKFHFHVPITLNFKSSGRTNIDQDVRSYLATAPDTHIIGIDRGERHLLYLVVIDQKGKIVEQYSLNEIDNSYTSVKTNYHDILDKREKDRLEARQNWQTIEGIKNLKEGYLSAVVHKVAQLMVKYHAIVVLEDLNPGFLRGRQKVEKQVYQDFEHKLIDKLNYLVNKKAKTDEPGGLLKALQLTSQFASFQKLSKLGKIGKQSGFLFYIPAWNTSKIDPKTGFVNLFNTEYENNVEKTKKFFCDFDRIRYNAEKDWFEFSFDYSNFTTRAEGTRTSWTICTVGDRIEKYRNGEKNSSFDTRTVQLTPEFKKLFKEADVDISGNIKEGIATQSEKPFFERLMYLFKLTLQMRNSMINSEVDYIVSPVADNDGSFYDSRTCGKSLPENADANGAYNIARKGLMILQQLHEADDSQTVKFDLSNRKWLKFAQDKPYMND